MIDLALHVEEYCHDCGFFKPEMVVAHADNCAFVSVHCQSQDRCRYLKQLLELKNKKEAKNDQN